MNQQTTSEIRKETLAQLETLRKKNGKPPGLTNRKQMNKGIRIINFIVDVLIMSIIIGIVSAFTNNIINIKLLWICVFLLYYVLLEFLLGQTVGKMITKTRVVDISKTKPNLLKIIIRTLLRLNPVDGISYLFGINLGTHDVLSRTKLEEIEK